MAGGGAASIAAAAWRAAGTLPRARGAPVHQQEHSEVPGQGAGPGGCLLALGGLERFAWAFVGTFCASCWDGRLGATLLPTLPPALLPRSHELLRIVLLVQGGPHLRC